MVDQRSTMLDLGVLFKLTDRRMRQPAEFKPLSACSSQFRHLIQRERCDRAFCCSHIVLKVLRIHMRLP